MNTPNDLDVCIKCGCLSEYSKTLPIDFRNYYIEGAGQLCQKCFEKTYGGENDDPDNYPQEY